MSVPNANGILGSIWPRHRANHRFALVSDGDLERQPPVPYLAQDVLPMGSFAALNPP